MISLAQSVSSRLSRFGSQDLGYMDRGGDPEIVTCRAAASRRVVQIVLVYLHTLTAGPQSRLEETKIGALYLTGLGHAKNQLPQQHRSKSFG